MATSVLWKSASLKGHSCKEIFNPDMFPSFMLLPSGWQLLPFKCSLTVLMPKRHTILLCCFAFLKQKIHKMWAALLCCWQGCDMWLRKCNWECVVRVICCLRLTMESKDCDLQALPTVYSIFLAPGLTPGMQNYDQRLEGLDLRLILTRLLAKFYSCFSEARTNLQPKFFFFFPFSITNKRKIWRKKKLPKHYTMYASNRVLNTRNYHSFCTAMASFMVEIVFQVKVYIGDGAVP